MLTSSDYQPEVGVRVVLLALGSRGDVQPFLVLAGRLQANGIDCVLVALQDYTELAERAGVAFQPIARSLAQEQGARMSGAIGALAVRSSPVQYLLLRRWIRRIAGPIADAVAQAVGPGDTVLSGILSRDCATAAAEHYGGHAATVVFTGVVPTAAGPSLFQAPLPTRTSPLNVWASTLAWRMATGLSLPPATLLRHRWRLPVLGSSAATAAADDHPVIVAVEPLLVPIPADRSITTHQTGSLVAASAQEYRPPSAVQEFLHDAPVPVYVGFGTPGSGYRPVSPVALERVAALAGCQIITPAPPGVPPGRVSDRLLLISDVAHEWLLPQTAAMVHHGGAGTTVAGLRAGVPSAAVPFIVDQPYHGRRLHRLGVGPAPLRRHRLTEDRLAALIRAMTTGPKAAAYRRRATEVGGQMRATDGPVLTVEALRELGLLPNPAAHS